MEDDDLSLPADTLKILNEFLQEKATREHNEQQNIETKAGKEATFEEDWQLSQFWYSEQTKSTLGKIVDKLLPKENTENYKIALLSCPSLYSTIKQLHDNVKIFEYDERFSAYGDDFILYDFNLVDSEEQYLSVHQKYFDLIIVDPPFLSEECISKSSKIVKLLSKSANTKIIFCSGEIVATWVMESLNLQQTKFRPQHQRNLGNEFACYANFALDELL